MKPHDAHIHARRAHALEWLKPRTVEDGDCLVWTLALNGGNSPCASIARVRSVNVRRWVFERTVRTLHEGERVVATCGNPRCLTHLQAMTHSEVNRWMGDTGRMSTPAVVASRRASARARASYTLEQARECRALRAQGLTLLQIQALTGVPWNRVSQICVGKAWREAANGASVFSWRPAA